MLNGSNNSWFLKKKVKAFAPKQTGEKKRGDKFSFQSGNNQE